MTRSRPMAYQAAQHHRFDSRQNVAPDRSIVTVCNLGNPASVHARAIGGSWPAIRHSGGYLAPE